MHILIFPGNYLPHTGGLESHVDLFAKHFAQRGHKVTIFTPNILNAKVSEKMHPGVQCIRYPAFSVVFNFPFPKFWQKKFWNLLFGLNKQKFDVVMTRTMFFSNTTLGTLFAKCRLQPKKLIHVEHASDFSHLDSALKRFVNKAYMYTWGNLTLLLANTW